MRTIVAAQILVCLLVCLPARGQSLLSVEPDNGEAGEQVPITVTGEPDAFFYETSILMFLPAGDKITYDQIEVIGSNVIQTTIDIAADTPPGLQDVSVQSGTQTFTGLELFEVTSGVTEPVIVSISPSSGVAGASFPVTVTGENTNFDSGSTLSFSGSGIQVGTVNPQSPTVLDAQITIASDAPLGPRNVTVTTGAEVATGEGLFTVTEPPVILDPDSGLQGETIASLTITGGPGGYSAATEVDLGEGISIGAVAGNGFTITLTNVVILADAPVGGHDLELTNPLFIAAGVFLVEQGPETLLLSITPATGDRGHPGLPVSLLGQNTHFDQSGIAIEFSSADIRAVDLTPVDPLNLEATLVIMPVAIEGSIDVSVVLGADTGCTDCEITTLAGGFEITAPGTLTAADPWILESGATPTVTMTATDGQFVQDETYLVFQPPDGIEPLAVTVTDADHLSAELQIADDAPGDPRDVIAVTGSEVALGPGLVDVFHPEIRRLSPGTAFPGTNPLVTVKGTDIPFDADTQVEFSGTGITVDSVTFDPEEPDEIAAQLTIAADAPLEKRDVTVTAGIIQVVGVELFEVVELTEKDDEGGCSCSASVPGTVATLSWLGLGLLGLLLCRRRGLGI
jgi:uncharacterized protein (TIGR03382 family)